MKSILKSFITFASLILFSCSTMVQIKNSKSPIAIDNIGSNKIEKLDKKILISGFITKDSKYAGNREKASVGLNDSICYYRYTDQEMYQYMPIKPVFFDLSKEIGFSIFPKLTNVKKIDFPIDDWLLNKLKYHDASFYSFYCNSPFVLLKRNIKYDSKAFSITGKTDITFFIELMVKPNLDPLLVQVAEAALAKKRSLSDLFIIESYPKELMIHRLEFNLFNNDVSQCLSQLFRWDYILSDDCNYLIIYLDGSTNIPEKSSFQIQVFGSYVR